MNSQRSLALWAIVLVLIYAMYQIYDSPSQGGNVREMNYTQFLEELERGNVASAEIAGAEITGLLTNNQRFSTYNPGDLAAFDRLRSANVAVKGSPPGDGISLLDRLIGWAPLLLLVAIWIFFFRQMQGTNGKALGFGKSKAKMLTENNVRVTFEDVAGVDEAKDDLQEIVEFLRDPQKFQRLGGKIPRGVLLVGPPGTGKTLLARAIAGEANVSFFTISGSDFVEMFVGVGASRVRDMFEQAKRNAPCIIFIDEIDAVGRHRGAGLGGGNDEREQTLNQLLVEMDGFEANEGTILIAATNRPDVLDPALLRPGRFDRQIVVNNPDVVGREKILKVHTRKVPLAPNVALKVLARGTPGFSGADLMNLVNEAALLAARRGRRLVTMQEFEDAKDKVMMGAERRTLMLDEDEKKLTAFHEAGHALVAIHEPAHDPIHKATIIPRGRALGLVMPLPEKDKLSITREELRARIAMAMGGRVAEEITFGYEKVTSGAQSDIQQVTRMARAMVMEYGMSDRLGTIAYAGNQEEVFLGHSVARQQNMSEETQKLIDAEVRDIVERGYERARQILTDHSDQLTIIAEGLLEYETLSGAEIEGLLKGTPPKRDDDADAAPKKPQNVLPTISAKPKRPDPNTEGIEPQPES